VKLHLHSSMRDLPQSSGRFQDNASIRPDHFFTYSSQFFTRPTIERFVASILDASLNNPQRSKYRA
jgi:hypothetical protein